MNTNQKNKSACLPVARNVTKVSDGINFSVHTYFDVSPESPDGRRVVYSRFTKGAPSCGVRIIEEEGRPGEVVVCDRDGSNGQVVGDFKNAYGHCGAYTLWINDHVISYQSEDCVFFVDLDSGHTRKYPGCLHMIDPLHGGIFTNTRFQTNRPDFLEDWEHAVYRMDPATGKTEVIVTVDQLLESPEIKSIVRNDGRWFANHAKWSPEGTRAACKLLHPEIKDIFLMTFKPDGSDIRHFQRFDGTLSKAALHWSFYDEESIYGYDAFSTQPLPIPLYRFDLGGAYIETLHEGDGNHASLSPSRRHITTDGMYGEDPLNIYLYEHQAKEGKIIATMKDNRTHTHAHPVFSADGCRVYFNCTDSVSHGNVCWVDVADLVS